MKTKKVLVSIAILGVILMLMPLETFAWLAVDSTYEKCNVLNVVISNAMKIIALIVGISYIVVSDMYMRYSKDPKEEKTTNVKKWLLITISQIVVLACGAIWVKIVGVETFWLATGDRVQPSLWSGYASIAMRIFSLILMLFYIVLAIIYYFKSEQKSNEKLKKIIEYQVITSIIIVVLLLCARIW